MRSARFALLVFMFFLNTLVWAQQTPTPVTQSQTNTPQQPPPLPPATKDAQAVSIVTQALNAVGGATAISAITDYTATGNVTYYLDVDRNVQGSVTVRGKGLGQFRLDATLPTGVRSEATDGMTTIKLENGSVQHLLTQAPITPARLALPYLHLNTALNSRGFSLFYKGSVDIDGHPAHDIQVQHVLGVAYGQNSEMTAYITIDFFIDPSTFQIVMMQDVLTNHRVRQIRYSNFTLVNGISVPFSISANISGQNMWLINLGEISFNSGLHDSDFQL